MAPKKQTAAAQTTVELPPLNIQRIDVPIVGESPLICHAWAKKAKEELLAKYMHKAKKARGAKDPWADFCETLYWLDTKPEAPRPADVESARFGFPAIAFKSAAVTAVTSLGKAVTKVAARQTFHIIGEFVEILGPPPSMREDMVRVGMGGPDVRHRAEFNPWAAILPIQFNAGVMSAEQIVQLINTGGFGCGIGDWRPERDGTYGRFRVATAAEMKRFVR